MIILQKPHITTKSTSLNKKNKYCFIVNKKSNKTEIKKAIKKLYGVSIDHINTMNYPRKAVTRNTKKGLIKGSKAAYKKAILTLASGSTIDLHVDAV